MVQFLELIRRLVEAKIEFVIVGGVAATLHGVAEPTRDLDVCISPNAEAWARVHAMLAPLNPRYALTPDLRPMAAQPEDLAAFKTLYVKTDLGRIDFLGEVPPLGKREALPTVTVDLDGMTVRVVGLDALIAVKEHVRRPKDLEVAAELRAIRARGLAGGGGTSR